MRRVLCQAVWAMHRLNPEAQEAYAAWVQKHPKRKKVFVVAQMRRLLIRLWHRAVEVRPATPRVWGRRGGPAQQWLNARVMPGQRALN